MKLSRKASSKYVSIESKIEFWNIAAKTHPIDTLGRVYENCIKKNPANKDDLNRELEVLLKDREMLYAGDYNDFCEILSKYGDTIND